MTTSRREPRAFHTTVRSTLITPSLLRRWPLPVTDGKYGKEARGCVLVVGGSDQIPGAVVMAATAALRAGAGKLQIATARRVAPWVGVTVPEARVIGLSTAHSGELARRACDVLGTEIAQCDALLLGPGMMDGRSGTAMLRRCTRRDDGPAIVVDAASLNIFAKKPKSATRAYPGGLILTPHAGEMATLWGLSKEQVMAHPLEIALEAAAHLRAVIALKGARTYVAGPDGVAFHNTAGNRGLGTSGSGDVLSGIIAGLCARGASALQATIWGVYLHARAGDALSRRMGREGYLARELPAEIPPLLARLGRP